MTVSVPIWAVEGVVIYAVTAILLIVIVKFCVLRDDDPRDMTAFALGVMWPVVLFRLLYDVCGGVWGWCCNRRSHDD